MALNQKNAVLRQAINESLSSLGEPIKKTVVWHLNLNGVFIESDQLDVTSFFRTLEDIMGNGADVVVETIYGILAKRKDFPVSRDRNHSILKRIQDSMKPDDEEGASVK